MSAIVNEARRPDVAARYRSVIADRAILISVVTVSELRYGAIVASAVVQGAEGHYAGDLSTVFAFQSATHRFDP